MPSSTLARSDDGFPAFDLMLIGVGLDGAGPAGPPALYLLITI